MTKRSKREAVATWTVDTDVLWRSRLDEARAAGYAWAEGKVDRLDGEISAVDWPDVWQSAWDGRLPAELIVEDASQRRALFEEAHHAARDRWLELVLDRRDRAPVEVQDHDHEARARALVETLRGDLPPALVAAHDGARAFLQDVETGEEWTIASLGHAWRLVRGWSQLRRRW